MPKRPHSENGGYGGGFVASNLRFGAFAVVRSRRQRFNLEKISKPEQSVCPPVSIERGQDDFWELGLPYFSNSEEFLSGCRASGNGGTITVKVKQIV